MSKLSDKIKNLIDNPDNLDTLAEIYDQSVEYENSEVEYQTRIDKLQEVNRNMLKMIPQPEAPEQPHEDDEEVENEIPTLDDGVAAMASLLEKE